MVGEKNETYDLPWLTIPLQSLILLAKRVAGTGQERLDRFRRFIPGRRHLGHALLVQILGLQGGFIALGQAAQDLGDLFGLVAVLMLIRR